MKDIQVSATINVSQAVSLGDSPQDISKKGEEKKKQNFHGYMFPKDPNTHRSFQEKWLESFEWIEYSGEKDAVYCYPCRQFGITNSSDVFCRQGYNNWQKALSKGKGFKMHESSNSHISAMLSWKEYQVRQATGKTVANVLNETVLQKRRHYFKSIVGVVLFLARNELPFRGNWNELEGDEFGLFTNLLKFTIENDEYLQRCQEAMPENGLYTSPQIQNEIIHLVAVTLREKVVSEMKQSTFWTLMADGTRDRNGNEILSIAVRYVRDGHPLERLLVFEKVEDITAKGLVEVIIEQIESCGLESKKLISQCHDGASVISGKNGGVQKLLQDHFGRTIPYVHCFNHRLHLVVVALVNDTRSCTQFFDQVKLVHNFFSRFKVRRIYEGILLLLYLLIQ